MKKIKYKRQPDKTGEPKQKPQSVIAIGAVKLVESLSLTCQSVLEQDAEPLAAHYVQVGTWHSMAWHSVPSVYKCVFEQVSAV